MDGAEIWEHIEKLIVLPTNPKLLATHVKKESKEKQIILDLIMDQFIPHIVSVIGRQDHTTKIGISHVVSALKLMASKVDPIGLGCKGNHKIGQWR